MTDVVFQSEAGVTLLGGGELHKASFDAALKRAPDLVAADGAAGTALDLAVMPEAVIGDFDSLKADTRSQIPIERQYPIAEQDSTDFEKCLSRIEAPLILGVGFTGRRIDHELAVYNAMLRHSHKRCILVSEFDVVMVAPREITLPLPIGSRLSLFPLGDVKGRSTGLRWPIEGIPFTPTGSIGTSNEVTAQNVSLAFDREQMLLILPRNRLDVLIEAVLK